MTAADPIIVTKAQIDAFYARQRLNEAAPAMLKVLKAARANLCDWPNERFLVAEIDEVIKLAEDK